MLQEIDGNAMRELMANNSQLLKDDDWVQLRKVVAPEHKINGYTYSHEVRCNGDIVCFLPYEKGLFTYHKFLLRNEAVPCWELDMPSLCAFTGGVDKGSNPFLTCIKELEEEAGYVLDSPELTQRVKSLGTSFGIKSSDSVYHLFAIDVTDFPENKKKELFVETDLESSATNIWVDTKELIEQAKDPFPVLIAMKLVVACKFSLQI